MGIVKQYDKRTGNTYVYESKAYWDKDKKQSRAKRTLIGKLDPDTGEIVATDGRGRKRKSAEEKKEQNYKELYEKLLKKCESQEILIRSLQSQLEAFGKK